MIVGASVTALGVIVLAVIVTALYLEMNEFDQRIVRKTAKNALIWLTAVFAVLLILFGINEMATS